MVLPIGNGDIFDPNAWTNTTSTLGVGVIASAVAQGDIVNPNAWNTGSITTFSILLTELGFPITAETGEFILV
jgi:hypothetical protein